jgi:allantoin racemase
MPKILLINPNTSAATTEMMVRIAAAVMPPGFSVVGATAKNGPTMIINKPELDASEAEVFDCWRQAGAGCDGVIVGAFGDPGIALVRADTALPACGLCEASMLEAAGSGRRFGVATVTPDLQQSIAAIAVRLGLGAAYTGIRLTEGPPRALAADPAKLEAALALAVSACIERDGAQAVIIGGGPLGQAAVQLAGRFSVPVIAPIESAARKLVAMIAG